MTLSRKPDRDADAARDITGQHAWARMMRVSQRVLAAVEADLKAGGFLPLGWYDVLLELGRAPSEGLRPVDLQERLLLAQYNLSRLIDRMVAADLVERRPCPDDRRAQRLVQTRAGRARQRAMAPAYLTAIETHFAGKLTDADRADLLRILGKLDADG